MHDTPDHELLRRYADHGAEDAFTELVRRHFDLAWAAARRVSGDADAARDIAQTVFADLARKAGRLPAGTVLAGWLYRAACHAAAKQVRGEIRRAQREQKAMQQDQFPPTGADVAEARAAAELQPVLDAVLAELSEADRDAVSLRFLAGRSLAEVGAALGANEDAAQKRVSRALEKLRAAFQRRGVTVSGGTLAVALGVAGTQTAPAGLAATVASGALAGVGPASWLLLMKSKLALGIVGGAAMATALVQQQRNVNRLGDDNAALRQQIAALAAPLPVVPAGDDTGELERLRSEHAELLRLRGEVARLRQDVSSALEKRARVAESRAAEAEASAALVVAMDAARQHSLQIVNSMKYLGLAAHVFASDGQARFPTTFEEMRREMGLSADGTLPGGIAPDQFEFFAHDRVISLREPEMILFWEKSARQLPDGSWQRIYCLVDGSVQTIGKPANDFWVRARPQGHGGQCAEAAVEKY